MAKTMTEAELNKQLRGIPDSDAPSGKKAKTNGHAPVRGKGKVTTKKATRVASVPKAPFKIHAMGMKNDAYCKVFESGADSRSEALKLVSVWTEKSDVHEVIVHIR